MLRLTSLYRLLIPFVRLQLQYRASGLLRFYYKYMYEPKANSIAAVLDEYSRRLGSQMTVVQVGANDGMIHDPINKFIKRDRWRGVLLEPQQYVHDNFLKKVYASDDVYTICAAVGDADGYSTLYKVGWCDMRWASGLASFQRSVLEAAYDSGLVQRAAHKHGLTVPDDRSVHIVQEQVVVVSPATLIAQYELTEISLLMIDTEGYDYEVIKLFDIAHTKPGMIIYEHIHLSDSDKRQCQFMLESHGYSFQQYGANTVATIQRRS